MGESSSFLQLCGADTTQTPKSKKSSPANEHVGKRPFDKVSGSKRAKTRRKNTENRKNGKNPFPEEDTKENTPL
jgi:hypothetical protein